MSDKVTPIPLPERGQNLNNGPGVIAGWGWGVTLTQASWLKHLVVPLIDHSTCKLQHAGNARTPTVDDNMFCTDARNMQNVCFGDAGGAFAIKDNETGDIYAAGILSYDKSCRGPDYAVYMKISEYLPWIHKVMRGDTETSSALRSEAMSKMFSWQE